MVKTNLRSVLLILFVCFIAVATNKVFASSVPAISISGPNIGFDSVGSNSTSGYDFTPNDDYFVTALGIYDQDSDGIAAGYEVGLWDASQNLLGSVAVPTGSGGTLVESYRYQNLTVPLRINSGQAYRIGAFVENPNDIVTDASISSTVGTIGSTIFYERNSSLIYPTTEYNSREYMTANMLISNIPIPGAVWLIGSGLIGLVGLRRKFKK